MTFVALVASLRAGTDFDWEATSVRRFGRGVVLAAVAVIVLVVLVLGLSVGAAAHRATDRDAVSGWFHHPELHQAARDGFLTIPEGDDAPEERAQAELMADVIGEVLTFDTYVRLVDAYVGASFDWLSGATDAPRVEVQISAEPALLEARLAAVVGERVAALPVCENTVPTTVEGMLAAECRPADVAPALVERELARALQEGPFASVFDDGMLRTDPIQPAAIQNPELVRAAFTGARWSPVLLAFLVLALLGLAQSVIRDRMRGSRFAGRLLVAASGVVAVGLVVAWLRGGAVAERIQLAVPVTADEVSALMGLVTERAVGSVLIWSSLWTGMALVLGVGLLVYARFAAFRAGAGAGSAVDSTFGPMQVDSAPSTVELGIATNGDGPPAPPEDGSRPRQASPDDPSRTAPQPIVISIIDPSAREARDASP